LPSYLLGEFLRVLHIWNTAGVASVIAKYQAKILGWETWVITRSKYDPYNLTYYGTKVKDPNYIFYIRVLLIARRYDLIHLHSFDKIIPLMKKIYPNKPIVMHYHGSEIRNKWESKKRYWSKADVVLISTRDLLNNAPNDVIYLPNPVDLEVFKPMSNLTKNMNAAIYVYDPLNPALSKDITWAKEIAKRYKLNLKIHNRRKTPINHLNMPLFLNKFEYFIDRKSIPSLSKTGLEALACGLKVIRWDNNVITRLPSDHKPKYVIEKLYDIYESILRNTVF